MLLTVATFGSGVPPGPAAVKYPVSALTKLPAGGRQHPAIPTISVRSSAMKMPWLVKRLPPPNRICPVGGAVRALDENTVLPMLMILPFRFLGAGPLT
jgi:hypothetical protein